MKIICALTLAFLTMGLQSAFAAADTDATNIKKDVDALVSKKSLFCIVSINYGSTDTQGSFYLACDGNAKGQVFAGQGKAQANMSLAVSAIIEKGMKLTSCSFANAFRTEVSLYPEEHCYLVGQ